jgi:hypothetical protein
MIFMAGVFRPHKKAMSQKAMELEAAREILAEVFRVRLSEVDEMIHNRFQLPVMKIWSLKKAGCGHKSSGWMNEVLPICC